jgi:hypothetical protein
VSVAATTGEATRRDQLTEALDAEETTRESAGREEPRDRTERGG